MKNVSPSQTHKVCFRVFSVLALFFFLPANTGLAEFSALPLQPPATAPLNYPSHNKLFLENSVEDLPEELGQIVRSFDGGSSKILIQIQDAHANEEAQRNITKIIGYYAEHHKLTTVALEGSEGDLSPELLSFFPNKKVLRSVADFNLKQARMNGSEYAAIVENPGLHLFGVEEEALYEKNRRAFLSALPRQQDDERVLNLLGEILENLTRFVFSDKLRELNSNRKQFHAETLDLSAYVAYLVKVAKENGLRLDEFPHMQSLLSLIDLEESVDFNGAEKEIDSLISDLKKVISKERLSRFLTNTVQFRLKKMRRSDFYSYLEEEIKGAADKSIEDKYSHVLGYLRYIQVYDSISVAIFDEIEKLESVYKETFLKSEDEIELDRFLRIFEVYQRLFSFSLTKHDAGFFFTHRKDFSTASFYQFLQPLLNKFHFSDQLPDNLAILDGDLEIIERYYTLAVERDNILIENAVKKMDQDNLEIIVLVAGGFHTPGIEAYLMERGYSYKVIAPRISKLVDRPSEELLYEEALKKKPLPLEKKLIEAFISPAAGLLKDPRFQLAVEPLTPQRVAGGGVFLSNETNQLFPATIALMIGLELLSNPSTAETTMLRDLPYLESPAARFSLKNLIQHMAGTSVFLEGAGGHTQILVTPSSSGKIWTLVSGEVDFLIPTVTEMGLSVSDSDVADLGGGRGAVIVSADLDRVSAVFPSLPGRFARAKKSFDERRRRDATPKSPTVFPEEAAKLLAWMVERGARNYVFVDSIERFKTIVSDLGRTAAYVTELARARSELESILKRMEGNPSEIDLWVAGDTLGRMLDGFQNAVEAEAFAPLIGEVQALPDRLRFIYAFGQNLLRGDLRGLSLKDPMDTLKDNYAALQVDIQEVFGRAGKVDHPAVKAAHAAARDAVESMSRRIELKLFVALDEKLQEGSRKTAAVTQARMAPATKEGAALGSDSVIKREASLIVKAEGASVSSDGFNLLGYEGWGAALLSRMLAVFQVSGLPWLSKSFALSAARLSFGMADFTYFFLATLKSLYLHSTKVAGQGADLIQIAPDTHGFEVRRGVEASNLQRLAAAPFITIPAEIEAFGKTFDNRVTGLFADADFLAALGFLSTSAGDPRGAVVMNYHEGSLPHSFILRVHERVRTLPEGVNLILVKDSRTSDAAWQTLQSEMSRQTLAGRIIFRDELGTDLVVFLDQLGQKLGGIERSDMAQIIAGRGRTRADRAKIRRIELEAVELAQGTVLLLGFEWPVDGVRSKSVTQVLLAMLKYARAFAVSA